MPSPVSGSRTPRFPLLPVWKQRAGGSYRTGTRPLRGARASGAYAGGTPAHPAQPSGARPCRGRFGGKPRRACAVRAPPARTRAERPRTRRNPQVRAFAGAGLVASPGVPSPVSGSRTPRLPLLPLWEKGAGGMRGQMRKGMLAHLRQERAPCTVRAPPARTQAGRPRTRRNPQAHALAGAGLVASPGVPSFVSGIRTPRLPLLPLWEKGVGGMRGKCARECWRTPQVHTPLQGQVGWQTVRLYKRSQGLRVHTPLQGQVGWQAPACHLPFQAAGRPNTPFCLCGDEGLGKSHRGRFLGKPRRAIFRFRHQDAQTPPSPLVGEGGRGDEGARGMRDTFVPTLTRRRCPATRTERRGALAGANSLARRNTLAGRADAATPPVCV